MNHHTENLTPGLGRFAAAVIVWCVCASQLSAQAVEDLAALEEQAVREAVASVAPAVVRIETVGGLARVGNVNFGTGPTTGLIVSEDGYIIASAFNFAQQPASILVGLPDGSRTPADLVASDKSRMLVLLKVNVGEPLPVSGFVAADEIHVGQRAIAVGRTFEGDQPNVSVGIVSALGRIWGKAIQTDAKISPSNYGGPLVDLHGRVMGVLVPLSPTAADEVAGVEWYDSGIGFAIPMDHINHVLPRLQSGNDLLPGVMGVNLKGRDIYSDVAEIGVVRPNSPAFRAGLKSGDRIVGVDGHDISRIAQLQHQFRPKYAGDSIRVAVLRGEERIEVEMQLVDQLQPYEHPFLGILPMRTPGDAGVQVRYVFPESPAGGAGLSPGDRITSIEGHDVATARALLDALSGRIVGDAVSLEIERDDEHETVQLTLTGLSTEIPDELPPARFEEVALPEEQPATGQIAIQIPEFENSCLAYVPDGYNPTVPHGVVIWLRNAGGADEEPLLARWRAICDDADLILLAPQPADPSRWRPTEIGFVRKTIDHVMTHYHVDPARIVVHGHQAGASMAYLVGFRHRDVVRGVAAVAGRFAGSPAENEPVERLTFFITTAAESRHAESVDSGIQRLRAMKYPVTVVEQAAPAGYLNDEELAALVRWIDSLDRL